MPLFMASAVGDVHNFPFFPCARPTFLAHTEALRRGLSVLRRRCRALRLPASPLSPSLATTVAARDAPIRGLRMDALQRAGGGCA